VQHDVFELKCRGKAKGLEVKQQLCCKDPIVFIRVNDAKNSDGFSKPVGPGSNF